MEKHVPLIHNNWYTLDFCGNLMVFHISVRGLFCLILVNTYLMCIFPVLHLSIFPYSFHSSCLFISYTISFILILSKMWSTALPSSCFWHTHTHTHTHTQGHLHPLMHRAAFHQGPCVWVHHFSSDSMYTSTYIQISLSSGCLIKYSSETFVLRLHF